MSDASDQFREALLSLDRLAARKLVEETAGNGSIQTVVDELVTPALERIGDEWEAGDLALAQVYMAGRICEELVDLVLPPGSSDRVSHPVIAISVLDDYHLLGKRIVHSMLRASGYEVLDYGRCDVDQLVEKTLADSVQILLISTLMLPSALKVADVRSALDEADADVRIVVGGAPFRLDPKLWEEVGADAMGQDASDAVEIIAHLSEAFDVAE